MRGMDEGSFDKERDYKETGVCQLTPFLYTGTSPWPFKYSVPTSTGGEK
jgi:hypothetical protein